MITGAVRYRVNAKMLVLRYDPEREFSKSGGACDSIAKISDVLFGCSCAWPRYSQYRLRFANAIVSFEEEDADAFMYDDGCRDESLYDDLCRREARECTIINVCHM